METLQRFGDYHMVAKLARGGMAEIFLAKRFGVGGFERNVVIKRMLDDLTTESEFVTMFLDEARLAAKLTHPNIAQITDFGLIDNRYYICMEHIAGEDLRVISTKCRDKNVQIPIDVGLRIIMAVCEGLEYAHEMTEEGVPLNIVHRDVSPSNVMVTYQGSVKLLDFGIAKATSRVGETTTGKLKGKITFMSPEQVQGGTLDGRSDVFSLGLTAYELLTQKRVFHRDSDMASLNAVLHAPVPKPTEFRADLPMEVEKILMRSLERDLALRYPTAGAMRDDIQAYLSRIDTEPGARKLADFMVGLFGREQMLRRTNIPRLGEQHPSPFNLEKVKAAAAAAATSSGQSSDEIDPHNLTAHSATVSAKRSDTLNEIPVTKRSRTPEILAGTGLVVALVAAIAVWQSRGRAPAPVAPTPSAVVEPAKVAPATPPAAPTPVAAPVVAAPIVPAAAPAAAPTKPKAAAPPVKLSMPIIAGVIGKSHAKLLACFENNRGALSAREGQVVLTLTVVAAGKVTEAEVSTPGISSTALSACLAREMKRLAFPRHQDQSVTFNAPFTYRIP